MYSCYSRHSRPFISSDMRFIDCLSIPWSKKKKEKKKKRAGRLDSSLNVAARKQTVQRKRENHAKSRRAIGSDLGSRCIRHVRFAKRGTIPALDKQTAITVHTPRLAYHSEPVCRNDCSQHSTSITIANRMQLRSNASGSDWSANVCFGVIFLKLGFSTLSTSVSEFRSCVKVEVAVLGFPS